LLRLLLSFLDLKTIKKNWTNNNPENILKNKTVKRVESHLYLGPIKIYNEERKKKEKDLRGTLKLW